MPSKYQSLKAMSGMAGMGILAALMVVSVVTVIAVKQSWQNELDLLRSGHRWAGMQADAYMRGAEQLTILALTKDLEKSTFDGRTEDWAAGFDFPTDHGGMQVRIVDAQGRLNLNALGEPFRLNANNQPLPGADKYSEPQRRFIRLVQTIPLDEDETVLDLSSAEMLLEAVKDWIDTDNNVSGFGGAEQGHYEGLDVPFTIANTLMASTSELMLIKGMTPELYIGLRPHVMVLNDVSAKLNVNSISQQMARTFNVSKDLYPLDEESAQTLFSDLSAEDLEDMGDLNSLPAISTLFPNGTVTSSTGQSPDEGGNQGQNANQEKLDISDLTNASGWFEIEITVMVGEHVRSGRALIDRKSAKVRIVRRSDSQF